MLNGRGCCVASFSSFFVYSDRQDPRLPDCTDFLAGNAALRLMVRAHSRRIRMFDAEIAATLLNRWNHRSPARGRDLYLELLREGNLHFTHQFGYVRIDVLREGNLLLPHRWG